MSYRAEIVDFWTTGADGARYSSVHRRVLSWGDVTGQQGTIPPSVNALVVGGQSKAVKVSDQLYHQESRAQR